MSGSGAISAKAIAKTVKILINRVIMILFFIDAVFCLRFNLFMNFYGTMFLIMDKDLP